MIGVAGMGVGVTAPLVDKDGFPRADVDLLVVRTKRNEIACTSLTSLHFFFLSKINCTLL